jgi:hypothetical protein
MEFGSINGVPSEHSKIGQKVIVFAWFIVSYTFSFMPPYSGAVDNQRHLTVADIAIARAFIAQQPMKKPHIPGRHVRRI